MKEKIAAYLRAHGGSAPALILARKFLRINPRSSAQAQALLQPILADSRFKTDGVGNWYLQQADTVRETAGLPALWLAVYGGNIKSLAAGQPLEVHFCRFESSGPGERVVIAARGTEISASGDLKSLKASLQSEAVLLSGAPVQMRAAITYCARLLKETWPLSWECNWRHLLQNALQSEKPVSDQKACQLLGLTERDPQNLAAQLDLRVEIISAMLQSTFLAGPLTLEAIMRLGEKPSARVSFAAFAFDEKSIDELPQSPGTYHFLNRRKQVIYVGKALNLARRLQQYFRVPDRDDEKARNVLSKTRSFAVFPCETELDALLDEQSAIRRLQPEINVQRTLQQPKTSARGLPAAVMMLPSATAARWIIYIYAAPDFWLRLAWRFKGRKPEKKLLKALQKLYKKLAAAEGLPDAVTWKEEVLQTARWLGVRQDKLSWFAPDACADAAAAFDLAKRYLSVPPEDAGSLDIRPEPGQGRVE